MVKIKCHQYNAAIKIAANVNTFLFVLCERETAAAERTDTEKEQRGTIATPTTNRYNKKKHPRKGNLHGDVNAIASADDSWNHLKRDSFAFFALVISFGRCSMHLSDHYNTFRFSKIDFIRFIKSAIENECCAAHLYVWLIAQSSSLL